MSNPFSFDFTNSPYVRNRGVIDPYTQSTPLYRPAGQSPVAPNSRSSIEAFLQEMAGQKAIAGATSINPATIDTRFGGSGQSVDFTFPGTARTVYGTASPELGLDNASVSAYLPSTNDPAVAGNFGRPLTSDPNNIQNNSDLFAIEGVVDFGANTQELQALKQERDAFFATKPDATDQDFSNYLLEKAGATQSKGLFDSFTDFSSPEAAKASLGNIGAAAGGALQAFQIINTIRAQNAAIDATREGQRLARRSLRNAEISHDNKILGLEEQQRQRGGGGGVSFQRLRKR